MPIAPGWAYRSASAVATGTTSLTITTPAGVVDDDILLMMLSHKSSGYATLPAGWTLVAQNISGSTRGEMYWKRASGEGASYSITGLSDTATGCMTAYTGGLLVGDVVDAGISRANASGTKGAGSLTTLSDQTLVVMGVALGMAATVSQGSTQGTAPYDFDVSSLIVTVTGSTTLGTDCAVAQLHAVKMIAGPTGIIVPTHSAAENVCILAAFIPDTTTSSAGSRYYFTTQVPGVRVDEAVVGGWVATVFDPIVWSSDDPYTFRLAQRKAGGGQAQDLIWATNQQPNFDAIISRWMTPPLDAQTISGTVDLCWAAVTRWQNVVTPWTTETTAQWKLHIYVTVGETAVVRGVLLDQYLDATDLPKDTAGTRIWTSLTSAQTLASVAAQAGDCVMVEFGVRLVSSPTPAPNYPPDHWSQVPLRGWGTTNAIQSGVPLLTDAVAGTTDLNQVAWIDFSHTFVEQALPSAPSNDDASTARIIASLPYVDPSYNSTGSRGNQRETWYQFTAPDTKTYLLQSLGTGFEGFLEVFTGTPGALVRNVLDFYNHAVAVPQRSQGIGALDATLGTTYYIRLTAQSSSTNAPSCGGSVRFALSAQEAPQVDDLYVPCGSLTVWRDGVMVNWTPDLYSSVPSGIVLDYSQLPIDDLNGGINTNYRVYMGLHSFELVEILDADTLDRGTFEVDFIGDPWTSTSDHTATLALKPDNTGDLYAGWFGNGYLFVSGEGLSLPAFLDTVSSPTTLGNVRSLNRTHADLQTGAPWAAAAFHPAPPEVSAPYAITLADDGTTLFYTSGGYYRPLGAQTIRRYDVGTDTSMSDFATLPASGGPNDDLHGVTALPDSVGGILVCNGSQIVWLDETGSTVRTYTPSVSALLLGAIRDARLLSTGDRFWCMSETGYQFQFDLQTGAERQGFQTYLPAGNLLQLALFQPAGIAPTVLPSFNVQSRPIRRMRRTPHLITDNLWQFFHELEVHLQTGIGLTTGQGSDPQIMMRVSYDGGRTWSSERWVSAGEIGKYRKRARWLKLGRGRNAVFEITVTDPNFWAVVDCYLEADGGVS